MTAINTKEGHVYFIEYRCVDQKGNTIESFDHKRYAVHYRLKDPNVFRIDVYHHYGSKKNPLEVKFFKTAWTKPKPKAYLRQKPQRS